MSHVFHFLQVPDYPAGFFLRTDFCIFLPSSNFSNRLSFASSTDIWPTSTTTESAATAFPSRLRDARSEIQVLSAEDRETWAMTTTACPQCANPEMRYRDVQLRGADEGSTVFYRCPKCDYK